MNGTVLLSSKMLRRFGSTTAPAGAAAQLSKRKFQEQAWEVVRQILRKLAAIVVTKKALQKNSFCLSGLPHVPTPLGRCTAGV
jgi:hypothetical protein